MYKAEVCLKKKSNVEEGNQHNYCTLDPRRLYAVESAGRKVRKLMYEVCECRYFDSTASKTIYKLSLSDYLKNYRVFP